MQTVIRSKYPVPGTDYLPNTKDSTWLSAFRQVPKASLLFILLLAVASLSAVAQKRTKPVPPAKRPLNHDVYDSWKTISSKELSNDGKFAVFTINPQDGDGRAVVYDFNRMREDSIQRASNITLSFDSRFALFKINPPKELVKDLRRQKKKKEELPKDSLGIYNLQTRQITRIPLVKTYKTPEKASGWVAYLRDVKPEEKKVDSTKKATAKKKVRKNTDETGYTLVLQSLDDTTTFKFGYVLDYLFPKQGKGLLFSTTGNDSTLKAGVYWHDLATKTTLQLYAGHPKQKYRGLAASEDGTQACFLVDADTTKALVRYHKLYYWKQGDTTGSLIADEKSQDMPGTWVVNGHYTPNFSKNGSRLFFGISPIPAVRDTLKLEEEIVKVEVWGYRDEVIYPEQNKQYDLEIRRSYLATIDLETKRIIALADKDVPDVYPGDEGNAPVALGISNKSYRWNSFYDSHSAADVYVINTTDGTRKTVRKNLRGKAQLSPGARYVYWFDAADTSWHTYSVRDDKTYDVTKAITAAMADELNDRPATPEPYGIAGWTTEDDALLVYDRYDIWSVDPRNQRAPQNLTRVGRDRQLVFRYMILDLEERAITSGSEVLLSAFDENTKASGYYRLSLTTGELHPLIMSNHTYAGVTKAKDTDRLLYTRENFREAPDLWTTTTAFKLPRKITDANPQMKDYRWGSVELVSWTSLDGVPLRGLLYKPEGFDPAKKYPMMVYFYERSSDELNAFVMPQPSASTINRALYASNGYLVFVPDIVYKIGFPGESAYNCIMPGVASLINKGFVDAQHMGLQGQSWGGYQTAFLVTRTNLFKAAGAGAPVVNMTSAYGGIRWGSGFSRMFQYEQTQSRIGGTLWEKPLYYIENSPLFFADKIETPLLVMHNDADGAVPWYQGIEFYMALRRMNKPVWMLVYNNEDHNLQQRQNRKDLSVRMLQFFDHYLKGTPMPPWMAQGVPAIEKGITTGYGWK